MQYFQHEKALVSPQAKIGKNTRIWAFTNVQVGAVIGEDCNVCDGCFVEKGAKVGNHVTIKHGVAVFDGVTLEDDVFCGSNVAFINDRYPRSNRSSPWKLERIMIKKGAAIGSNVTILCGITVGEYSVIGAGSVVTQNVAAQTIVFGNPAEFKGYVCRCGQKLPKNFHCACGVRYRLEDNVLKII